MNTVIVVAGVIGLLVAGYFFFDLARDAFRRREYLDLVVAALVAAGVVWLLFSYGDTLLQ